MKKLLFGSLMLLFIAAVAANKDTKSFIPSQYASVRDTVPSDTTDTTDTMRSLAMTEMWYNVNDTTPTDTTDTTHTLRSLAMNERWYNIKDTTPTDTTDTTGINAYRMEALLAKN